MMTGDALFQGSYVALITPFANGAVDEAAFRKLVSWQIEQGTNGLILLVRRANLQHLIMMNINR
jgi:dihydrodipicolinate synthase/N-acetylneuraminate lyase